MNQLYKSIFHNVYLSKHIYTLVHRLQQYDNSLKYDEIVDVVWMIQYKHVDLLMDKVKRNCLLSNVQYSKMIIPALVERDLEVFKIFYTKYIKYSYTFDEVDNKWCDDTFEQVVATNSIEAIQWMCDNGLACELKVGSIDFSTIDPEILRYLLINHWFHVDYNELLDKTYSWSPKSFSPEISRILVEFTPRPITSKQAQDIINTMLINPHKNIHLFQVLEPLFQDNLCINVDFPSYMKHYSICPILSNLIEKKRLDKKSQLKVEKKYESMKTIELMTKFIDSAVLVGYHVEFNQLVTKYFSKKFTSQTFVDCRTLESRLYALPIDAIHALLDHGLQLDQQWFQDCLVYGSKELMFSLWNRFNSNGQIQVESFRIGFYPDPNEQYNQINLSPIWDWLDIGIIEFLLRLHPTQDTKSYLKRGYIGIKAKKLNQHEMGLLETYIEMGIFSYFNLLLVCVEDRNTSLFKLIYPMKCTVLSIQEIDNLFEKSIKYQLIEILALLKFDFPENRDYLALVRGEFKLSFLKEMRFINSSPKQILRDLLVKFIKENNYSCAKHMLSIFEYTNTDEVELLHAMFLETTQSCNYANKERNNIVTSEPMVHLFHEYKKRFKSTLLNQSNFWGDFMENALYSRIFGIGFNQMIDYVVGNNLVINLYQYNLDFIDVQEMPTQALLYIKSLLEPDSCKHIIDKPLLDSNIKVNDLMYLIDTQIIDTIHPFIQFITTTTLEKENGCRCLEYLVKNLHKFKDGKDKQHKILDQILNQPIPNYLSSYIKLHFNK
ncbi:hypothetical protein CYY_000601 [Polysphondylium violaceum]|uniref:Uncharacterized protein n=1 Tax=Polysphondylium violaceum TaxID=133409 RepID=A0A8J4Q3M3_9MYCE|nr:hypothetical protein CYY_000601 [Polysphondylium violaceum]